MPIVRGGRNPGQVVAVVRQPYLLMQLQTNHSFTGCITNLCVWMCVHARNRTQLRLRRSLIYYN